MLLWALCCYFLLPASLGTLGLALALCPCCHWSPEHQSLGLQEAGPLDLGGFISLVAILCLGSHTWAASFWEAHRPFKDPAEGHPWTRTIQGLRGSWRLSLDSSYRKTKILTCMKGGPRIIGRDKLAFLL